MACLRWMLEGDDAFIVHGNPSALGSEMPPDAVVCFLDLVSLPLSWDLACFSVDRSRYRPEDHC